MGNSTSLGQGGSQTIDKRDMEGDGFKDGGRPPEVSQLAEEKPLEEPQNPNPNLPHQ